MKISEIKLLVSKGLSLWSRMKVLGLDPLLLIF